MEGTQEVHVLLMKNCSNCEKKLIKYTFDLKGSELNRFEPFSDYEPTGCMKDENVKALKNMREFLKFSQEDKDTIMATFQRDVNFLRKFNLMDYSLFLVVTYRPSYIRKHP